jgi:hypothetical protein
VLTNTAREWETRLSATTPLFPWCKEKGAKLCGKLQSTDVTDTVVCLEPNQKKGGESSSLPP